MPLRIDASASRLGSTFSDQVRASGAMAGANALMDVGDRVARIGLRWQQDAEERRLKQEREADAVWLAQTTADSRLRWTKDLQDGLNAYDGSTEGFADGFLKGYRKDVTTQIEAAPERVRPQLAVQLIQQGELMAAAAIEGEAGRRQAHILRGIRTAGDTEAEGLLVNPDLYPDAVESITQIIAAAPEALRPGLESELLTQMATAYSEGLMQKDPARLVQELEAGMLDQSIDPKLKALWLDRGRGEVERREVAAQQAADQELRDLESRAQNLSGRVVAYVNAGMAPPKDLLAAAQEAVKVAAEAGSERAGGYAEGVEIAYYSARRQAREESRRMADNTIDVIRDAVELGMAPDTKLIEQGLAYASAAKAPDLMQELADIGAMAGKRQEFAFMSPDQLAARERELRSAPATRGSVLELKMLLQVSEGRAKAVANQDLAGFVSNQGVALPVLSATDPQFGEKAAHRASVMGAASQTMGADFQFFGKDERETFARQLEEMPADQRLATLGKLAGVLGPNAPLALQEISESAPLDAQAGVLLLQGRQRAAADALAGQAAIKANPKLAPPRGNADAQLVESTVIGAALSQNLTSERQGLLDAAAGIYAQERLRTGRADGELDVDAWGRALQKAAGAQNDRGGFGTVNGTRILLPPQLSEKDVSDMLSGGTVLGRDAFKYSYGDPENGQPGGPPAFRDPKSGELQRFPADQLKGSRLVTVSPGLYWVSVTDPAAGAQYVLDLDTGEPFILDLRDAQPGGR